MQRAFAFLLLFLSVTIPLCAQDEAAALYKSKCANCHNNNGDGKTTAGRKMVIPDIRSPEVQNLSDDQLFQTIGNGTQHKQYPHTFLSKGMTTSQVRQLVGHIRTLKTKR